ncbi:gluconokinase [Roseivirga sp. E12]|uniref:gluconokinase n=1 Tax=Roseivirga sp. E12 TaxID=2819237 RepID=UPI001ABC8207|nr:gluconokinase [Roseivirga sp. E12]MBO3697402.1 gluconokinase [Roseivirga sp. E12]
MHSKKLIIVMGITGSGKSTVGKALSEKLGVPFLDADDFHPQENIKKMSRSIPLNDDDRWPWLGAIVEYVLQAHRKEFVLACSALKQSYRDYLGQRLDNQYLFLDLSQDEAERRLSERSSHFMPQALVKSQLTTLEPPSGALNLGATLSIDEIVKEAQSHFADFI